LEDDSGLSKIDRSHPKVPVADAKAKLAFCRERLAQYQMYIGHFYYHKGAYPAAAYRFNKVVKEYGDLESRRALSPGLDIQGPGAKIENRNHLALVAGEISESRYRDEANGLFQRLNDKQAS
jgi:hypothetical protein